MTRHEIAAAVFKVLSDRTPRTIGELIEITGCTFDEVDGAIRSLHRDRIINRVELHWPQSGRACEGVVLA